MLGRAGGPVLRLAGARSAAWRLASVALAVALLALAPLAVAQSGGSPVIVTPPTEDTRALRIGEGTTLEYSLFNTNSGTDFFVTVSTRGLDGWTESASPNRFFVGPRETATVAVVLVAGEAAQETATATVRFEILNSDTGAASVVEHDVSLSVVDAARVLGVIRNPLPAPLDNAYGVFLLDLAFWAVFGVASFLAGDTIVRLITRRARAETTRSLIQKLRLPVFVLVLFLGFLQSVDVLPVNPVTTFVRKFVAVLAVGIVGAYVAYRIIDSALYYYSAEIAPKTTTRVDDVIVPFVRKLALIILIVVAIGYTLSVFGLDPSVIFAGAGIAGLVIAFAAQDTLSNFFSGIFLILDRPFLEGDYVQLESGETCVVEDIGLRSTRLMHTLHNQLIVLPNNQLASRRVINLSAPTPEYRVLVNFAVAYGVDTDLVQAVAQRAVLETPRVVREKVPQVLFMEFADSGLAFQARVFIEDARERRRVASDIRENIHRAFLKEGIEFPYPQRVVHVRGDPATLAGGPEATRTVPVSGRAAPSPPALASPASPPRSTTGAGPREQSAE